MQLDRPWLIDVCEKQKGGQAGTSAFRRAFFNGFSQPDIL